MRDTLAKAMGRHRPLMLFAALTVVLTVATLVGLVVDERVLLGDSVWLKPFKFAFAFTVTAVAWAWMYSLRPKRLAHLAGTAMAVSGTVEIAIIVMQAARGTRSHFNSDTAFDSTVFAVMGLTIAVFWVGSLIAALMLAYGKFAPPALTLAIRLGATLSLIGMSLGILMFTVNTSPDNELGAHTVGAPDGGAGMALTGWSTEAGDLRIPHFIGLHALQLLPLFAFLLTKFTSLANEAVRLRLVWTAGVVYAGLIGVTTWQALRGQALLSPDGPTLVGFAAVVAVGVVGGLWAKAAAAESRVAVSV